MMFTSKMKHLTAAVLYSDSDAVSRELLRLGLLDFVRMETLMPEDIPPLSPAGEEKRPARIAEIRGRIENLVSALDEPLLKTVTLSVEAASALDIDVLEKELNSVAAHLQELRNRQREIHQEVMKLEDLRRQVILYDDFSPGAAVVQQRGTSGTFLAIKTGSLPAAVIDEVRNKLTRYPSVLVDFAEREGRIPLFVLCLKRDQNEVADILNQAGWNEGELPFESGRTRDEAVRDLDQKLTGLKEQRRSVSDEYRRALWEKRDWFRTQWASLSVYERLGNIWSYFSRTDHTVLFTGWVPAVDRERIEERLKAAAPDGCYIEWHDPQEIESESGGKIPVPVELHNPQFLKPFEMLVENYAVPRYGTVDPTPFVAIAFLSMFGLMFADAGQGLILVLTGLLAPFMFKDASAGMKKLFTLIVYCGGTAVVSGILFGSYFGRPWFPPLWFNYHALIAGHDSGNPAIRSVYDILLITIYFGITVIAVGLLINWINLVKNRDWFSLIFEKAGILGGWIYGCGIYAAFYFVRTGYRALPEGSFLLAGFGIPALALFFKQPVHAGKSGEHGSPWRPTALPLYLMEWIVELLEIFSSYLANSLSFMRVAGLGIAHVSLMMAFDEIAGMAAGPGGGFGFWSILILIGGNLLVIALEGLSAGIQSLRLNYYEFFSKYFSGSGRAYAPISLRSNT